MDLEKLLMTWLCGLLVVAVTAALVILTAFAWTAPWVTLGKVVALITVPLAIGYATPKLT